MNIVKTIDQYNDTYVYFFDPIKNNIINEGNFVRILYSTPEFTLNGIYLLISLNDIVIEKYYNKYKCNFNVNTHSSLIEMIKHLEEKLLEKYNFGNKILYNKIPHFKIYEQVKNGNIKIFCDNIKKNHNNLFILKISGIWETELYYGLTYKFTKINN
jgi:hypothetical protein